jgi:hypothetical protein
MAHVGEVTTNGPDLRIIGAAWGLSRVTTTVINLVNRSTDPQSLSVAASNSVFGDGWYGIQKTLVVVYQYGEGGSVQVAVAKEGSTLTINRIPAAPATGRVDTPPPPLSILGATWGPADKTSALRGMVDPANQSLSVVANNATFGDTWPGMSKSLVVVAAYAGQVPFTDAVAEGQPYVLKFRPPLRIISATWGLKDVTAKVQTLVSRRALSLAATNAVLGVDGWYGKAKTLAVVYQYDSQAPQLAIATEGNTLSIDYQEQPHWEPSPDPRALQVVRAAWGPADVTPKVKTLITGQALDFVASDAVLGDSWPGKAKALSLTYGWGPMAASNLIVAEGSQVQVSLPAPPVTSGLVSLDGLLAGGDVCAFQASNGLYWAAQPGGQITASASSLGAATQFTIHPVLSQPGQISLTDPGGSAVIAGQDGTLRLGGQVPGAPLIASLSTNGVGTLSVVGAGHVFATLRDDGAILAAGTDTLTFDTAFSLVLKPTAAGLENHIRDLQLEVAPEDTPSPELLKLIWDLTGGCFLAIGLGPLVNGAAAPRAGIWALLQSSPRVSAALSSLIASLRANPGTTLSVGALLGFATTVWDAGLLWKVLRLCLDQGKWFVGAWVAARVLEFVLLPEVEAAELVVSFAIWAYTTTTDALAYINSGRSTMAPIPEPEEALALR